MESNLFCTVLATSQGVLIVSIPFQIFGDGSIAQAVLNGELDRGTTITINVGWAIGIIAGAYCAIGITGAHMNPAVTLAMAIRGKTSWLKVSTSIRSLTFTTQVVTISLS